MIANVPFPHFPVAQEMNRRRRHKTLCDDEGSDFFLPNATLSEMSKRGGKFKFARLTLLPGIGIDILMKGLVKSVSLNGLRPFTQSKLAQYKQLLTKPITSFYQLFIRRNHQVSRASFALHPGAIQGKEGIKFCHLATLLQERRRRQRARRRRYRSQSHQGRKQHQQS